MTIVNVSGTIMLLFDLYMIIKEDKLQKYVNSSEIFKIFFGGRYIILMMSVGAIYTGLIYNDIFSKSFNIFGSHFKIPFAFNASADNPIVLENSIGLDPKMPDQYTGTPYPFGVDPVWLTGNSTDSLI